MRKRYRVTIRTSQVFEESTHSRAHAARAADHIQTASDVQMGLYLNALDTLKLMSAVRAG